MEPPFCLEPTHLLILIFQLLEINKVGGEIGFWLFILVWSYQKGLGWYSWVNTSAYVKTSWSAKQCWLQVKTVPALEIKVIYKWCFSFTFMDSRWQAVKIWLRFREQGTFARNRDQAGKEALWIKRLHYSTLITKKTKKIKAFNPTQKPEIARLCIRSV